MVRVRRRTYIFHCTFGEKSRKKPFVLFLSDPYIRHAAQQHARRPAEDRLPTGGILSAVGTGDPVGGSEKIHTGEAEMRQRTSRVGEL